MGMGCWLIFVRDPRDIKKINKKIYPWRKNKVKDIRGEKITNVRYVGLLLLVADNTSQNRTNTVDSGKDWRCGAFT